MADNHQEEEGGDDDNNIFVYRGGRAPQYVTHAIIDPSVKIIDNEAFYENPLLTSVDFHNGITKIGLWAFCDTSLSGRVALPCVKDVDNGAFSGCALITEMDLPDAERLGASAFTKCRSLRQIKMPSVKAIDYNVFYDCENLTDVELPKLESMGTWAFENCRSLRRIGIPLKGDLFSPRHIFGRCENLSTVDIIGGIHKTISSLHMESWKNEMKEEIERINRLLPNITAREKTGAIREWIQTVIDRIEHYKAEHNLLLIEATTLIELALWQANLIENKNDSLESKTKKAKVDVDEERKERRVTCGADIVIKNVLPFLKLE